MASSKCLRACGPVCAFFVIPVQLAACLASCTAACVARDP